MSNRLAPIALLLLAVGCSDPSGPTPTEIKSLPRSLSAVETDLISSSNRFGFGLFREVNANFHDKNVFLSPLSASMALGMTMNGAAGTTFEEMRAALGFGTQSLADIDRGYQSLITLLRDLDPGVQFKLANAIWYDQSIGAGLNPDFLSATKTFFDAEVSALDLRAPSAIATINDWANRNTNGKIKKVLDQLDDNIVMLLANAIYFKGSWRTQFDKGKTAPEPFAAAGGTRNTPTMQQKLTVGYGTVNGTQVIDIPYGGNAFSMTVLLPPEGTNIDGYVDQLTSSGWQSAVTALEQQRVILHLPRFQLSWEDTLNRSLKSLGMRQAFVPDGADFTRMSSALGRKLYISFVKQNTFVDVNEEGTEAAAVTTVGIGLTSAPAPPAVVRVDRPFVFALRERLSGTILFLGKIADPTTN